MRITAGEKQATQRRILDAAVNLFRTRGFDATTTRDIAVEAGIATGTLFNYFATKEAIVDCLAGEALAKARSNIDEPNGEAELAEELFSLVAMELRQLKPLRKFIRPVLETSLSPLTARKGTESHDTFRVGHLEIVSQLARIHGLAELSPMALHVYWTLYVGVLAFWAADKSPKQEDTLALLDQSLTMFVTWLLSDQASTAK
jgi:AcrR family transcriptional regulator